MAKRSEKEMRYLKRKYAIITADYRWEVEATSEREALGIAERRYLPPGCSWTPRVEEIW